MIPANAPGSPPYGQKHKRPGETGHANGRTRRKLAPWDHEYRDGVKGLVSVIGVKLTEARSVAEQVIDLVCQKLGQKRPASRTATTPIHGGEASREQVDERALGTHAAYLKTVYGSAFDRVLRYGSQDQGLLDPVWSGSPVLKAEIVHAIREEMALTLSDIVRRRTELGTFENPGDQALRTVAAVAARELQWSSSRQKTELAQLKDSYAMRFPWSSVREAPCDAGQFAGVGSR